MGVFDLGLNISVNASVHHNNTLSPSKTFTSIPDTDVSANSSQHSTHVMDAFDLGPNASAIVNASGHNTPANPKTFTDDPDIHRHSAHSTMNFLAFGFQVHTSFVNVSMTHHVTHLAPTQPISNDYSVNDMNTPPVAHPHPSPNNTISNYNTSFDLFSNYRLDNSNGIPASSNANTSFDPVYVIMMLNTRVLYAIFHVCIVTLLNLFGAITNVINIVVFIRQKTAFPQNNYVVLMALTVSDLLCTLVQIWIGMSLGIAIFTHPSTLTFDPWDVYRLTGYRPKILLTQINCWITAFLTLQRCLGRRVFSPQRSALAILILVICNIVVFIPVLSADYLGRRDGYLQAMSTAPIGDYVETIAKIINMFLIRAAAILTSIACNALIMLRHFKSSPNNKRSKPVRTHAGIEVKLSKLSARTAADIEKALEISDTMESQNTGWMSRRNDNNKPMPPMMTERETELRMGKVNVVISVLFVVCYVPQTAMLCLTTVLDSTLGEQQLGILLGFQFLLETVKSSVNIFVVYYLNPNYRYDFRDLFDLNRIKVVVV